MRTNRIVILLFAMSMALQSLAQQESLFSQYMFNPFVINPAYAGNSKSLHLTASARKQWLGMDGAPSTQTLSVHAPLMHEKIGVGIILINDNVGVTNQRSLAAAYAYKIHLGNEQVFSFGLQGACTQFTSAYSILNTRQENDPSFGSDMVSGFIPSFGTGLYFEGKKIYIGAALPHLVNNVFLDKQISSNVFQRRHLLITSGYIFTMSSSWKLKPSLLIKAAAGVPIQADINLNGLLKEVLWIGASYRTNKTCNILIQIQATNQLRLGYAYDFWLSQSKSLGKGSHEIILNYNFSFVKSKMVTPRYF